LNSFSAWAWAEHGGLLSVVRQLQQQQQQQQQQAAAVENRQGDRVVSLLGSHNDATRPSGLVTNEDNKQITAY